MQEPRRICTALSDQFKLHDIQEALIVSFRKTYGGIETVTIQLPTACKLLDVEKVHIGLYSRSRKCPEFKEALNTVRK